MICKPEPEGCGVRAMATTEDRDREFNARVLLTSTVICAGMAGGYSIYRSYLRRFPDTARLPSRMLRQRSLLGKVTSVGDADNFHFFHTPGGYFAGWGWLRKTPKINTRGLKGQTIHVRLCGIDAPEGAHFGRPAQPYSGEALQWLRNYILGRRVRIVPLSKDQYSRTVADVTVWKLTGRKNVSREMLKNGWAVVYEGKTGAEFNGHEQEFMRLEGKAQKKRLGIFKKGKSIETPGEYKRRYFGRN